MSRGPHGYRASLPFADPDKATVASPKVAGRAPGTGSASQLATPAATAVTLTTTTGVVQSTEPAVPDTARVPDRRVEVEPLTAELRRLHVTVDRQFLKLLDVARDGLSHSTPGASMEQVLKAALELLVEKQARARGQVKRPRAVQPSQTPAPVPAPTSTALEPRHRRSGPREAIPAAVRRAVWDRDGGRCQWPLDSGGRCGSTHRLELDHLEPWARDGEPTLEGLRLLCRPHNLLAARLVFGARCMGRYAGAPGDKPGRSRSRTG